MRWLFVDDSQEELKERRIVENHIKGWWSAFEKNAATIAASFSKKAEFDLPGWMQGTLQKIDHNLCWEYGPALRCKGHRLVITPESSRHLRPLTERILSLAPSMSGWEFYGYRPAEDLKTASMTCECRVGRDLDGVSVVVAKGRHNRIDLKFLFNKSEGLDEKVAFNTAFVATESLLGEEVLDKWIGSIEADFAPQKRSIGLERLQSTVQALIDSILDQLPADHFYKQYSDDQEWSSFSRKLKEPPTDCAGRDDIYVGGTCRFDVLSASTANFPFFSTSFSRHDERFCYLKIDGIDGLAEDGFQDRGEIEDAVHAALMEQGLGCRFGGGTGHRYSYVDLILTDVQQAIPVIQRVLIEGKIPVRTWLLFFDNDWVDEWVGIYPNTPVPPQTG